MHAISNTNQSQKFFLLTASCRDSNNRFEITLFAVSEEGEATLIVVDNFNPLFFINHSTPELSELKNISRKALPLKSIDGIDVDCLYFRTYRDLLETGKKLRNSNIIVYESDIHPIDRFLMERFISGTFEIRSAPKNTFYKNPIMRGCDAIIPFHVISIDIETCTNDNSLYSIACAGRKNRVFMLGDETNDAITIYCSTERDLLSQFFTFISEQDPDIIIGWYVIDFDLKILYERSIHHNIDFAIGRQKGARVFEARPNAPMIAKIPGRVVMDVPLMLRSYHQTFEEYSLDFVASQMLGKHKIIEKKGQAKIDEINRLFLENKPELARYNLDDAIITQEIFDKAQILPNAIERSKRSGQFLDRLGGSVSAFDFLYLPRLHRAGYVACDTIDAQQSNELLPGGFVIEPTPGLYDNILVFDFKSLYPSIIMSFKIDPLGLRNTTSEKITGPCGYSFATDNSILPALLFTLMEARAEAKRKKNNALSQAIKILMNSFYGVLGAPGCRFFSPILASTITRTGQFILKETIKFIEKSTGYKIIYGDTDSLFVHINNLTIDSETIGKSIATAVNEWLTVMLKEKFSAQSYLELQYESHFRYFFIPAQRGTNIGSKKHYCGAYQSDQGLKLIFKGMESARSDWTDLAKNVQQVLYKKVFLNEPYEDYLIEIVSKLKRGELDELLVYKKRLRKNLKEYTEQIPPHVQAAKKLDTPSGLIRYLITVNGPEPVQHRPSPPDYQHYIDSQIRPVADSILECIGKNFDAIISGQQSLFD